MREDRPRYMPGSGSRANEIVSGGYTRENMPGYATGADGEYLPPRQEVEYPQLHMTSGSMLAGAVHFGKYCDVPSKVPFPTLFLCTVLYSCTRTRYEYRTCVHGAQM